MIVISYDIAITHKDGAKRLRHISKLCQNYGIRVQNSVYECVIDYQTFLKLKKAILAEIDNTTDSVRFYNLGNKFENHIEHYGAKETLNMTGTLIL